ncbi:hypothetical protein [Thermocrinis jamiesonii]|jgi:Copper resistance protein D.|uniref:hypothetical protein n=1 Tax=Thermocrinis jamiesonii TaxID=1302351 RepID=UPI0004975E53|nr:hypothetical protein [Thermocrinis jamiesonii]
MIKSLLFLHLFFVTLWVGGMAYTLLFLRPSLSDIPDNHRLGFIKGVYGRFFLAVWLSILVIFLTGMALWHGYRKDFSTNFLFHLKLFLFAIMVLNFAYIYFFLYRKNKLSAIPSLVAINFLISILIYIIISWIA